MPNQLFPQEIIDNSAEANFSKHFVQTKLIYITVLLVLVTSFVALPLIRTDVSIKSNGVIQPLSERNQLTSLVTGKIDKLYIKENAFVEQGQRVAEILAPQLLEKLQFNIQRQKKLNKYLNDLHLLEQLDSTSVFNSVKLNTGKYRRSLLQFRQQLRSRAQSVTEAKRKYDRNQQLYERDLISEAKDEKTVFALYSARNKFWLLFEQQMNTWESDRVAFQNELNRLKTKNQQLSQRRDEYVITAPVSGTIQNMKGIYEGSPIYSNQVLAEISPDTGLVAECHIPPKNIGLIRKGMEVWFQVSAFDYNQWGLLTGEVQEISNDVTLINKQPVFTVRVSLDQNYLKLKNGYRGYLKKGMTLQARFTLAERSLFQLLFDNVNDWLNPKWNDGQLATGNKQ